ncbi:hypothetical protein [Ligilactobacillus equi]|uniref:Uncharacterized protein n=1 Tax=Ligilactobacillus equi DSM 15833 = JCM 10991 TaxID=1423740 RepID=A0A0R1T5L5_9LACO|nr:hypothetical protein [Ligilactobacillus equi]KRL76609.1 hypothetical protein FC36_GL001847 [Ligilactobacillus equi DSM 15833 = JCM 10991]
MLKKTKSIQLQGNSIVNGQTVATFSASLSTDGGSGSVNTYYPDQALYETNRKEVRKDKNDFADYVYAEEDKLFAEEETEA